MLRPKERVAAGQPIRRNMLHQLACPEDSKTSDNPLYRNLWRLSRSRLVGRDDGRLVGRDDGRLVGRDDGRFVGRDDGRFVGRDDGWF